MSAVECQICFLSYNEKEQTPRILTCGHTICQQCAINLSKNALSITCPFDRKITQLNSNGVNGLQKNFALLELARSENQEQGKASAETAYVPCFEDPSHEAAFYCQHCEVDLCDLCFTSVHKPKALSGHPKIKLSEKPIKLPKCPIHPHNIAEFLCTDAECTKPTKIMCQTCVLFDQHKAHKYDFLMEQLLKNEQALKNLLEKYEKHRHLGMMHIGTIARNLESYDVSGAAFQNTKQALSNLFDKRKKEALDKLTLFANGKKEEQTALKTRLEEELREFEEFGKRIEKKLKMKSNLHSADGIAYNTQWSWNVSPDELEGFNDKHITVSTMHLQIKSKSIMQET